MEVVLHRLNRIEQLREVPPAIRPMLGVEVDVRYHGDELVVSHDPFHHGSHGSQVAVFAEWLRVYCQLGFRGPLIVNVKSEGVEERCIELLRRSAVERWFFLDLSMPYFVKFARLAAEGTLDGFGPDNLAVRFSEFEAIEYALGFAGMARWVWVDSFSELPLDAESARRFRDSGFKTCLVSPELQKHPTGRIAEFRLALRSSGVVLDAVCTKRPDLWDDGDFAGVSP